MLAYSVICSLDGYVVDAHGKFDWAKPDEEVHAFINDLERPVQTYLYGRRLYDVMRIWETVETDERVEQDYAAIWRAADKVVYSTTLDEVSTARTRLERTFDVDEVRELKTTSDVSIGGPTFAAHALRAGLVDEVHLFVTPIVVGGGTPVFADGLWLPLELVDERRFASGFVHLHYAA